jgi:hypothetical protein
MTATTRLAGIAREFGRALIVLFTLYFPISFAMIGLGPVIDAAVINEPFGWPGRAQAVLTILLTFVVYWRRPQIPVWEVSKFGLTAAAAFFVLNFVVFDGSMDPRTSGSIYWIAKFSLAWVASLCAGAVVVLGD